MKPKPKTLTPLEAVNEIRDNNNGQVVLVLQGGGALGAYQGGVYQALHETGVEPDWIIGTSIGAINAGIIAGNKAEDRLAEAQGILAAHGTQQASGALPAWAGVAERSRVMDDADERHSRLLRNAHPALSSVPRSRSVPTMPASIRPSHCVGRWKSWSISRSLIKTIPG